MRLHELWKPSSDYSDIMPFNKERGSSVFYIENFALRLLFCVGTCVAAVVLVTFIKAEFISHEPYVFDVVKCVLFPAALGVLAAFMWKPRKK